MEAVHGYKKLEQRMPKRTDEILVLEWHRCRIGTEEVVGQCPRFYLGGRELKMF